MKNCHCIKNIYFTVAVCICVSLYETCRCVINSILKNRHYIKNIYLSVTVGIAGKNSRLNDIDIYGYILSCNGECNSLFSCFGEIIGEFNACESVTSVVWL